MKKYLSIGINDHINSIKKPMVWLVVGFMDVSLKYKRTILGPWWNTLGIALIISVLSSIWASLLKTDINFFTSRTNRSTAFNSSLSSISLSGANNTIQNFVVDGCE